MTNLLLVATWYAGIYVGGPLYCGGTYDTQRAPWVAVDVGEYESGRVRCGDWLRISDGTREGGGTTLVARALDAGYLSRYYVEDYGPGLRIGIDVPRHLWPWDGLSRVVTVENVTRELEREVLP